MIYAVGSGARHPASEGQSWDVFTQASLETCSCITAWGAGKVGRRLMGLGFEVLGDGMTGDREDGAVHSQTQGLENCSWSVLHNKEADQEKGRRDEQDPGWGKGNPRVAVPS